MIIFKDLTMEGFGSIIPETHFNLDRPGLNVIRGKVGSGKTTIPSALSWCLFGQTLKHKSQVETWEEKQPTSYRGTSITVEFMKKNDIYRVTRCLSFKGKIKVGEKKMKGGSNLFIFINGQPFTEARNKGDKQKAIEDILGYSFDLFKSSVIFGQKMKKIIEESGPQKKKIFEEAFEVGFIEEAKDSVKEELNKLKDAKHEIDNDIENTVDKIEDKESFYKEALENEKNFKKNKEETLKEYNEIIQELKDEKKSILTKEIPNGNNLKKLRAKIEKLQDKRDEANENNRKIEELKDKQEDTSDEIDKLVKAKSAKVKTCPSCGQKLGKEGTKQYEKELEKKINHLGLQLIRYKADLGNLKFIDKDSIQEKIIKNRRKYNEAQYAIEEVDKAKKKIPGIEDRIKTFQNKIDKLEKQKLEIKSDTYKKQISKLEKKLTTLKNDISSLEKSIEIKEWLVKDPLSNNGIKAYLFNSLLSQVNQALDDYSRILGFQVEFGIDLDTHRKDFYQAILFEGMVKPYEDFSGGQKQLIDTAVAFAIHDVVSSIRPTNILFLDEPFESLGVDEIEIIEELVEEKSKGKSLYLITHHQSFTPRNINEITLSRGEDGVSTIQ